MLSGHRQPPVCHPSLPIPLSRPSSSKLITAASFPSPKIFTNALLSNHDITSLIRDTEAHERSLFSVPPPPPPPTSSSSTAQLSPPVSDPQKAPKASSRRQTVFNVSGGEVTTGPPAARAAHHHPRRNTAVAAVLGGEMHAAITRRAAPSSSSHSHSQQQGPSAVAAAADVDIEVLLQGAEKLCHVYPLPGALERIPALRQRWASQAGTLQYYEAKVAGQAERLGRMNNKRGEEVEEDEDQDLNVGIMDSLMTEEDLRREEEEVRELDKKKRELQERLRAMDKDLGGLRNM